MQSEDTNFTFISNPSKAELLMNDTDEESLTDEYKADRYEVEIDFKTQRQARLGVLFIMDSLVSKLPDKYRQIAVKEDRVKKWNIMIRHGLDPVLVPNVVSNVQDYAEILEEMDDKEMPPIKFTNLARIGLSNFFLTNPQLLL